MNKILVITDVPDPHVDLVAPHLKNSEFMIFDTSLFPNGTDITYHLGTNDSQFAIYSEHRELRDVSAVWFRKPKYLNRYMLADFKIPSDYHDFILANHEAAVTALYDLLDDKFWVSKVRSLERASNKILQLQIAKSVGLTVPQTLVTSSAAEVEKFRAMHGEIATKSIHLPVVKIRKRNHMFPTTKISKNEKLDLTGLGLAPAIFQEIIERDTDLRVTVIGLDVFACEIRRTNSSTDLDYRSGITSDELEYQIHELPLEIQEKCLQMLKLLGLEFGAFDFILDSSGRYVFIEVNPNGQWGWIADNAQLPMAESMARLLEKC